jgi:lipoate-protein ligase A
MGDLIMALQHFSWRVIDTGLHSGPQNMAIDEAIMRAHGRGEVPPTLRFYGWEPAAVSIGYFQSMTKEIDLDAVRAGGFGYVRRSTGGRMIFHHMELTYSVTIGQELLPGDVTETYRELSKGLLAGLRYLGGAPVLSDGEEDPRRANPAGFNTACFDTPSAYELTVNDRKIAGSAQTRKEGVILQQGSILLDLDVDLLFRLMRVPAASYDQLKERLRSKATSVTEALGRSVSYAEARDAFIQGFTTGLGIHLLEAPLTDAEEADAALLVADKYGNDTWNLKR